MSAGGTVGRGPRRRRREPLVQPLEIGQIRIVIFRPVRHLRQFAELLAPRQPVQQAPALPLARGDHLPGKAVDRAGPHRFALPRSARRFFRHLGKADAVQRQRGGAAALHQPRRAGHEAQHLLGASPAVLVAGGDGLRLAHEPAGMGAEAHGQRMAGGELMRHEAVDRVAGNLRIGGAFGELGALCLRCHTPELRGDAVAQGEIRRLTGIA